MSSQKDQKFHTSVLLKESIDSLNLKPAGRYIDCTLGEAGHSLQIIKRLAKEGKLLSIDRDQEVIDFVKQKYSQQLKENQWKIAKGNFSKINFFSKNFIDHADGILMDLGISSRQLEIEDRGFSYQKDDELLDMRMDQNLAVTAKDLLKVLSESELTKLFRLYGEEKMANRIARAIKNSPKEIQTVRDLNALVDRVMPAASKSSNKHPARRVYQALRIAVNDELNSLKEALTDGFQMLDKDGRLVVISFHSLEDRIVKNFFKEKINTGEAVEIGENPILPTESEIELNPRARSAKLRVIARI